MLKWLRPASAPRPSRFAGYQVNATIADDGLEISSATARHVIPWTDVGRVVAARHDGYIGNTLMLMFERVEGGVAAVDEQCPAWRALTERLPGYLPGAKPYSLWGLEIIASQDGVSEVYRRTAQPSPSGGTRG